MKASGYLPVQADLDYIESVAEPIHPVLCEIEDAAEQPRVPIVDRAVGRALAALAAHRPRIVEVGTAFGYSTLWMALAQPHRGTIVTIDPDIERTNRAKSWWRQAGIPDERITIVNRPALEAFADEEEVALQGPFDMAFIDAIKTEYRAYFDAIIPRLASGAVVAVDNVLWSGRLASEDRDGDANTAALREFNAVVLRDRRFNSTILPVGDGLLIAALR